MPRQPSAARKAQSAILSTFENLPKKVFTYSELRSLLNRYHKVWDLPDYFGVSQFIKFLQQHGRLQESQLSSTEYRSKTLYSWGNVSVYQIGSAIHPEAYLSHWTACFLHGLTDQIPQTVYVNKEQSEKPSRSSGLTQEGIDRAFRNTPRVSKYIFSWNDRRICLLSGKHTGRLEVGEVKGPQGEVVPATKLERTLIDISVRPQYAGGIYEVASAYKAAKGRASTNVILATLSKLNYLYPYHQAIGFYMWKTGYPQSSVELLHAHGMTHDFYLTNRMPDPVYVKEWRLFVPKGFETLD